MLGVLIFYIAAQLILHDGIRRLEQEEERPELPARREPACQCRRKAG